MKMNHFTQTLTALTKSMLTGPARIGSLFAIGFVTTTLIAVAVTGTIKTWTTGEVLKAADLNTTIASLQTAIDSVPLWTKGTSNATYYTAGNVGIGTTTPSGRHSYGERGRDNDGCELANSK